MCVLIHVICAHGHGQIVDRFAAAAERPQDRLGDAAGPVLVDDQIGHRRAGKGRLQHHPAGDLAAEFGLGTEQEFQRIEAALAVRDDAHRPRAGANEGGQPTAVFGDALLGIDRRDFDREAVGAQRLDLAAEIVGQPQLAGVDQQAAEVGRHDHQLVAAQLVEHGGVGRFDPTGVEAAVA